jgi:hypothetical protein
MEQLAFWTLRPGKDVGKKCGNLASLAIHRNNSKAETKR